MWHAGQVSPDVVDRMEVWQVAAALGIKPDTGGDLLAERVAAAREGRPPPDPTAGPVSATVARRNLRVG